ncbi:SAGA histone acetylase and TREX-2 complexes component [Steccherinum ochraceum]|uniref:Transcription and mRNA export factor SUS1 n=1 Tax=Steccherinum ochraceum TaxID=92696 RepID=A0A4R0RI61_9APHY|nr:SAGA histone acetylase and TREX-2 complexes component [Steccherinum ochraceum]
MPDARDALYAQIQRRMVNSGDWDRISEALEAKLNESGWIDSLHDSSKETARAGESVSVGTLLESLGSQAASSVSPKVKEEIIQMIRQYLDTQLDK